MDYEQFLRQHEKLDLPDYETELDLASSQIAWEWNKELHVDNIEQISEPKRTQLLDDWQYESNRIRENFGRLPQRVSVDPKEGESAYVAACKKFVESGFDEKIVEESYSKVLKERDTKYWELAEEVFLSAVDELADEKLRRITKNLIDENRRHCEQGTNPKLTSSNFHNRYFEKSIDYAPIDVCLKTIFEEQGFGLDDFSPEEQETVLSDWENEIKARTLELTQKEQEFVEPQNCDKSNSEVESNAERTGAINEIFDDQWHRELTLDLEQAGVEVSANNMDFTPHEHDIKRLLFDDGISDNRSERRQEVENNGDIEPFKENEHDFDRRDDKGGGGERGR